MTSQVEEGLGAKVFAIVGSPPAPSAVQPCLPL